MCVFQTDERGMNIPGKENMHPYMGSGKGRAHPGPGVPYGQSPSSVGIGSCSQMG